MTKMSISEARAEAVTVVLKILMLRRLTRLEWAEVYARALEEGSEIGLSEIVEEIDWLFAEPPNGVGGMRTRDGC